MFMFMCVSNNVFYSCECLQNMMSCADKFTIIVTFLVTNVQYSASQSSNSSINLLTQPLAKQEQCKGDVSVLQQMCELKEEQTENNWELLNCIERSQPSRQPRQKYFLGHINIFAGFPRTGRSRTHARTSCGTSSWR